MPRCAAVKNLRSSDQCGADALNGHTLCGRHIRAASPRIWVDVFAEKVRRFAKVQALYRGWRIRNLLAVAGPGVLRRADCVNDDDLVTCETKHRQHPFDYFGIVEDGKIWWFDFGTIWEWCIRTVTPLNPYTRTPIVHTDLARLRWLHLYRRRHRLPVPPPSRDLSVNIERRWTVLAQVFRSYGFEDIHPEQFANLNHRNLRDMFRFLSEDIESMRIPNHRIITLCMKGMLIPSVSNSSYMISALNLMTIAVTDTRSYDVIFLVLSALHRC